PVVGTARFVVRLSEEGLDEGNADNIGNDDTTDVRTFSGTLNVSDPNNDALTLRFGTPPTVLRSGGTEIKWSVDDAGTLTGSVNGQPVITAEFTSSGGDFKITLYKPLDH